MKNEYIKGNQKGKFMNKLSVIKLFVINFS